MLPSPSLASPPAATAHPTAIPLHRLAMEAAGSNVASLRDRYGDAFFITLAAAPPAPMHRPRMTHDMPAPDGRAHAVTSAALPVRARSAGPQAFLVVGRNEGADIPIFDATVSKSHALIERMADGSYRICDARSRNGTFAGGVLVPPRALGPAVVLATGAVVRFGSVMTSFVDLERLVVIARSLGGGR